MRLGPVLSRHDFPAPELGALVLDGEVFRIDDCVAPIDEIPGPLVRAAALGAELPPRLIAEQHSAAWVWGAQAQPPERHEVCADVTARARPALGALLAVREVVLAPGDTAEIAGLVVTTPLRTTIDLARFVPVWSDGESAIIRALLTIGRLEIADCATAMNRKRNLPNKRVALARLAACG